MNTETLLRRLDAILTKVAWFDASEHTPQNAPTKLRAMELIEQLRADLRADPTDAREGDAEGA